MLLRVLLPSLFLSASFSQDVVYDAETRNETAIEKNCTEETTEYKLFDTYYPLMILLISMPENETESLLKYLRQRNYAELKRMISEKQKANDNGLSSELIEANSTDLTSIVAGESKKYVELVEAYHNASIYGAIRGLWNSQLNPIMPPIDQLAVLEYFADKTHTENLRMTMWAKLWAVIKSWLMGQTHKDGTVLCNADSPRCVRVLVEKLPLETRVELEKAVEEDDADIISNIVSQELNNFPEASRTELLNWRKENEPPAALKDILESATEVEKQSLERLRENYLIHSLKDYYRASIEAMPVYEQEEIRQFFRRMNESFAGCYNPIRGKYEFN